MATQWLPSSHLKTARAWRIKEALRDIYALHASTEQTGKSLKRWLHWAQRSRLQPIKDLAKSIKAHFAGIVTAFEADHLHTGYVEAVNSLTQTAKAKARVHATAERL